MAISFPPRYRGMSSCRARPGRCSCRQRALPGEVPILADHVDDLAVLLEELVGRLEHGENQRAFRCPGGVTAPRRPPYEIAGADFEPCLRAFLVHQPALDHVGLLD